VRAVVLLLDLIDAYILVLSFQSVLRRRDRRVFGTCCFLLRELKYFLRNYFYVGGFIKINLFVSKQSLRSV